MGHTPFGYRIENGIAVIDEDAAGKLRRLYENYLSGLSLKDAAAKAGIDTYHGTAKRLLKTQHYIGDDFYPYSGQQRRLCCVWRDLEAAQAGHRLDHRTELP